MATYLAWPVSGTHTIISGERGSIIKIFDILQLIENISALLGFTLVENRLEGVNAGNPNPFNGSGIFKVSCREYFLLIFKYIYFRSSMDCWSPRP